MFHKEFNSETFFYLATSYKCDHPESGKFKYLHYCKMLVFYSLLQYM